VAFQDEYGQLSRRRNVQLIVEKKLAIYARALSFVPESEPLLLGYLRACQEGKDGDELVELWATVIKSRPYSLALWRNFLRFRLASFQTAGLPSIRKVFEEALVALVALRDRQRREGNIRPSVQEVTSFLMPY